MEIAEKTITADELDRRFAEILEEIGRGGVVYIVDTGDRDTRTAPSGLVSERGTISFVLGPPDICGRVFGLYDEEYGWPIRIEISEVRGASDLSPRRRHHPLIMRGDTVLALGVMIREYERLKAQRPAP